MIYFVKCIVNRRLLPNDGDLLTEETIDTFGNMCLSPSIHSQICQKIIRYIKNNAPNDVKSPFRIFISSLLVHHLN